MDNRLGVLQTIRWRVSVPQRMQRRTVLLFVSVLAMLVTVSCATADSRGGNIIPGAGNSGSASVDDGKKLYQAECVVCHGADGARLPVAPLDSAEFLNTRGDATLLTVIAEGKGVMPASAKDRGGPLDDTQIRSVLAYLSSKVGRTSSSLLADDGRTTFLANCVRCHGEKGDRIPVAPLNAKGFLDGRTDSELVRTISDGKGLMPAWSKAKGGPLADEKIRAAVAYLRFNVEAGVVQRARQGRDLYVGNCLACHGERGDRIPNITLASGSYLTAAGDGSLIAVVNDGKGVMPAFGRAKGGPFGIPETAALLAYMKSWAGLSATSALSGPEQAGAGRDLFIRNCTPCHGETGDRVGGVQLKSLAFLSNRTDRILKQTITQGNAQGMPSWGKVNGGPFSEEQIDGIVQYLKSSATPGAGGDTPAQPVGGSGAGGAPAPAKAAAPAAGAAPSAAMISQGKEIFTKNCVACHGETRDKIPTCKLADKDWLGQKGNDGIIQAITNGKPPMMPTWGKAKGGPLSDDEIKSVAAYLQDAAGLKGGSAPAAAGASAAPAAGGVDDALADKGKEIFTKNCVACHGETRDKIPTCKLADKDWLSQKGDDGIIQAITNGKPPMMPTWGKAKGGPLSDDEIKSVAAYLKKAAGLGGSGGAAAPAAPASGGSGGVASKGKEVYTKNCVACHGESRDLQPNCKLADASWLKQKGDDGLITAITKGKAGTIMPAWEGKISADDIKNIAAYLKEAAGAGGGAASNTTPAPSAAAPAASLTSASDDVQPTVTMGKELFTKNCVMCHGKDGMQQASCPIGDKEWIMNNTSEGLRTRINNGKPNRGMPSWGKSAGGPLSDNQISAIMMYLREGVQP